MNKLEIFIFVGAFLAMIASKLMLNKAFMEQGKELERANAVVKLYNEILAIEKLKQTYKNVDENNG